MSPFDAAYLETVRRDGAYHTPAGRAWSLASLPGGPAAITYIHFLYSVVEATVSVRPGQNPTPVILHGSLRVLRSLERAGGQVHVTGLNHLASVQGGVVVIGNHMSTLETVLLPALMTPFKDLTYVLKTSLLSYPGFGRILRTMEPITVDRQNPRDDLAKVLEEGPKQLVAGRSMVVFPQSTRTSDFQPDAFNSLGIKLAKRAGVPVVPLALKTDMWGNGKMMKDMGAIKPERAVHLAFGKPMMVEGKGREEHQACIDHILEHLSRWREEAGEPPLKATLDRAALAANAPGDPSRAAAE